MTTLNDARSDLLSRLNTGKGIPCPCCDQKVKLYTRTITKLMARQLRYLYQHPGPVLCSVLEEIGKPERNHSKLKYWGFAIQDGKYWSITPAGRQFVEGTVDADKHKYVFNDIVYKESPKRVWFSNIKSDFHLPYTLDTPHHLAVDRLAA